MKEDLIQSLWNQGKGKELKMNTLEIERILQSSTKRAWTDLRRMVWFYLAVMMVLLVVTGMNISAYRSNPVWLGVNIALTLMAVGFLGFGVQLFGDMRRLDDMAESLTDLVRRQLCFFQTKYQVWLGVVSLAIWLLSFAVSMYAYHQDGHYGVHADGFLVAFEVMQLLAIYGIVRIAHHILARRILAAVEDIKAQTIEQTQTIEDGRKRRTLILVTAFMVGGALFVALLLHFLADHGN